VKTFLTTLAESSVIKLFTNTKNLGFTRTVNFGMAMHQDRDVLLLNSDTIVYDGWLDYIVAAAYSQDRVASVNPLTTQRGSHISCYPGLVRPYEGPLEVGDEDLNRFAKELNAGKYVEVHTTVGFCMYIRRSAIQDIGYFDAINFPVAYGEESDFCYRALKAGWRHLIAGDVFVTHLEGKSFSDRKARLMQEMFGKFIVLHPEVIVYDKTFRDRDPVRRLRAGLDLGRIRRLLAGGKTIDVYLPEDDAFAPSTSLAVWLEYRPLDGVLRFRFRDNPGSFPNLDIFNLPQDIAKLNYVMRVLNVSALECSSYPCRAALGQAAEGLPGEVRLNPTLVLSGSDYRPALPAP